MISLKNTHNIIHHTHNIIQHTQHIRYYTTHTTHTTRGNGVGGEREVFLDLGFAKLLNTKIQI